MSVIRYMYFYVLIFLKLQNNLKSICSLFIATDVDDFNFGTSIHYRSLTLREFLNFV